MKYNFKYSGLKDYYKTRRYVLESIRDAKKNWYKEYYQYELGTKTEQLEEYAKDRQIKRKGNWDILTPEETQQIELELQGRERSAEM